MCKLSALKLWFITECAYKSVSPETGGGSEPFSLPTTTLMNLHYTF